MAGYIKLHRQLLDSMQFSDPNYLKVWIWILLKANHKSGRVFMKINKGMTEIKVGRGQFVFGRHKASDELCMSDSKIYRIIKKLEKEGAITLKSNNHYTLLTVCKYDSYNKMDDNTEQPSEQPSEQPTDTNKNDKKGKKNGNKLPLSERELVFLQIMVDVTGRRFRTLDQKTRTQFNDIVNLKYTRDDLRKAATIALSEMKERGKDGYLTPEFITRPAEFEKYVTMKPKNQTLNGSTVIGGTKKIDHRNLPQ